MIYHLLMELIMKALIAISLLSLSLSAVARDIRISCAVSHNTQLVYENEISVPQNAKNISIANFDLFEMFMTSLPDGRYELQMLNSMEPSRTYATGALTSASPTLELSVWTREFLLETKCKLIE